MRFEEISVIVLIGYLTTSILLFSSSNISPPDPPSDPFGYPGYIFSWVGYYVSALTLVYSLLPNDPIGLLFKAALTLILGYALLKIILKVVEVIGGVLGGIIPG